MKTPMEVLLVDDDKDDCFFFCDALKAIDPAIGCNLAHNGEEALKKLQRMARTPDIIFVDINMPIMNGKEFLSNVRSFDSFSKIPVVICSTSNDERDIAHFRNLGCDYMVKPSHF